MFSDEQILKSTSMDSSRRRFIRSIGGAAAGLTGGLLAGCDVLSSDGDGNANRNETLGVMGRALTDAGQILSNVQEFSQSPSPLRSVAEVCGDAASELRSIEQNGDPLGESVTLFKRLEQAFRKCGNSLSSDPARAAAALETTLPLLRGSAQTRNEDLSGAFQTALSGSQVSGVALRGVGDPKVGEVVRKIFAHVGRASDNDLSQNAENLLQIEDPTGRSLFELDDAQVRNGLQRMVDSPEEARSIATNTTLADFRAVAKSRFVSGLSEMGQAFSTAGSLLPGLSFFVAAWSDNCSCGSYRNCSVTDKTTTPCGNDPESVEEAQDLGSRLDSVREGAGETLKAGKQMLKVTNGYSVYIKCCWEECVDTVCVPYVDAECEWTSGHCKWYLVKPKPNSGNGDGRCWFPNADLSDIKRRISSVSSKKCSC